MSAFDEAVGAALRSANRLDRVEQLVGSILTIAAITTLISRTRPPGPLGGLFAPEPADCSWCHEQHPTAQHYAVRAAEAAAKAVVSERPTRRVGFVTDVEGPDWLQQVDEQLDQAAAVAHHLRGRK